MKKILICLLTILVTTGLVVGATSAYYSDTETSTGNAFTAGTLDLNLEGGNSNVVKFTVTNMKPGDSQTGTWTILNAGSVAGYLDLESVTKSSDEYGCNEPEDLLDSTCGNPGTGEGDLLGLLNTQLFVDVNNNGTYNLGTDTYIYDGFASGLAGNYELNLPLASLGTNYITMVVNWPSTANDNLGQSDKLNLGMTFELGQTTGQ